MHPLEVLRRPLVTEKYTAAQEMGKYAFEVAGGANKRQIKEAVELAFHVHVRAVNVSWVPGKAKRLGRRVYQTSRWKKALVSLQQGDRIQVFEGL
ncbi:MAG: 50S ribosomal protein L23 [Chloroflexi bacterium]|nr:50S ribosomal protein L23 [Chloroflexota bacterium]